MTFALGAGLPETVQAVVSFAPVAALLTVIPGMDTAMVLRSAISHGRTHAYATGLGINAGAMAWGIAAAAGASALLAASEVAFMAVKLAGAAYMVWLGGSLLWKSWRRDRTLELPPGASAGSLTGSWARGAATNLLNPKVGVFYMALIPQFIPQGSAPVLMGVVLAGVHNILGLVWFTALILGTHFFRKWLQTARIATATDRITGTALVGFGTVLALEAR